MVKEKGLQGVFILRHGLLPSFYASTAEGMRKGVDRRCRRIKPNEMKCYTFLFHCQLLTRVSKGSKIKRGKFQKEKTERTMK